MLKMQSSEYQLIRANAKNIIFQDYIEIIRLETKTFSQNLESMYDADEDIIIDYVKNDEGQLLGYISYKDLDLSYDIYMFAVNERFRNRGIATELIKLLFDKNIILEVRESNKQAIKFYEKNGFNQIQRKTRYYQTEDALVYYREVKW